MEAKLEREQSRRRQAEAVLRQWNAEASSYSGGNGDGEASDVEQGSAAGHGSGGGGGGSPTPFGTMEGFPLWNASSAAPTLTYRPRPHESSGSLSRVAPLSKLHPSISSHKQMSQLADVMDRGFVYAFRLMSVSPLSRLVFLLYVAALHLFVFFVLAFHSHNLDTPGP